MTLVTTLITVTLSVVMGMCMGWLIGGYYDEEYRKAIIDHLSEKDQQQYHALWRQAVDRCRRRWKD